MMRTFFYKQEQRVETSTIKNENKFKGVVMAHDVIDGTEKT